MEPKFEVEKYSERSRIFHTNVTVGQSSIDHYGSWRSTTYNEVYNTHGRIVAHMVIDLLHISGVADVFVKPYEVSVHLDVNHQNHWDKQIDRTVQNAFGQLYKEKRPCSLVVKVALSNGRGEFHTNFEVSQSAIEDFRRPLRDSSDAYLKKIGSEGASLVRKLMALPGITSVWMHPYEVGIDIGKAFSWTEFGGDGETLEDKVKKAFEQVFGRILFDSK